MDIQIREFSDRTYRVDNADTNECLHPVTLEFVPVSQDNALRFKSVAEAEIALSNFSKKSGIIL